MTVVKFPVSRNRQAPKAAKQTAAPSSGSTFTRAAGIPVDRVRRPRNKAELTSLPVLNIHEADGTVTRYVVDKPSDDAVLVTLPPLWDWDGEVIETDDNGKVWMTPDMLDAHRRTEAARLAAEEMLEKLKAGVTDFDRWATDPPMTPERLLYIVWGLLRLKRIEKRELLRSMNQQRLAAARRGQAANRKAFEQRAAEAWRIFQAGDAKAGKPWPSKEACKLHLAATKGWSRSSCNEYLKDSNAHLAGQAEV